MSFIHLPHLPTRPITSAIISADLPSDVREALSKYGISLYLNRANPKLSHPVCSHPDLSVCYCGDGVLIRDIHAQVELPATIDDIVGEREVADCYPYDIAYDACQIGNFLFCRQDFTAPELLTRGLTVVNVRQGYAKCSVALVSEKAAITEDDALARVMRKCGIDVLQIRAGGVRLLGYSHGFIGGACGKIAPDTLAFFGAVGRHPQATEIELFCVKHKCKVVSLSNDELTDYGSLLPLTE